MKQVFFGVLTLLFVLCISCKTGESKKCIEHRLTYVTGVNAPNTGTLNVPIIIEVEYPVINGCGQFGKIIESSSGKTRTVEVEAMYVGCVCTQAVAIIKTQYEFLTSVSGNYTLKFKSSDTGFIRVDLDVN